MKADDTQALSSHSLFFSSKGTNDRKVLKSREIFIKVKDDSVYY